jgi:hypothetical protein
MTCEDSLPIHINTLSSELGKFCEEEIKIENPSDFEIKFKYLNNNPINFDISPREINIKPFDQSSFKIMYTPTTVDIV